MWCQACELERLTKWGESVNTEIENNCEQIIFEYENGRINYQERVMNVWNRRRQRDINNARGPNDGQQDEIIFESRRKNVPDIKAGDTDDDKTVKASNTWEENAMYAEKDGHYEEMEYYGPQERDDPWEEDELDNWNTDKWGNYDIFAEHNEEQQHYCPPPNCKQDE